MKFKIMKYYPEVMYCTWPDRSKSASYVHGIEGEMALISWNPPGHKTVYRAWVSIEWLTLS
jgi:hypothetical protein